MVYPETVTHPSTNRARRRVTTMLPLMPNTHRRRDSTVELSRIGFALAVCIEFATSSRRLPTKIWKLNMLRIYLVELSCVGGVYYAPVGCRDPVYNYATSVTGAENWKLGHDWRLVRSHRRHDATRLRCRQIVQTRRYCRQLVANSIHTADATQLDSSVVSASAVCIGLKPLALKIQ